MANKLVESKASKEVLTSCLDGLTLAMTANFEWNQRRREAIKPQFKAEFAEGLCTSTNPADEFLFGGDTSKRVKEIAELTKSKLCKGPLSSRGRQRFAPYPARGYRGGLVSGKGRSFRGRSSYSGNLSGQQHPFRNAPQPEKSAVAKSHRNWYVSRTVLEALVNDQRPFKAGQLQYCIAEWERLTLDPEVLDYVQHCHVEFISDPSQFSVQGQKNFSLQQQGVIHSEIENLLQLGVVSPSSHEIGECLSPIFVIPKGDGSYRLIFNLKNCNQSVLYRHFKMDALSSVIKMISPGDFFASLDLKHAYYSVPIAAEHRKFFKFRWGTGLYEFNALPMGLSSSPRIFTKLMKPPLAHLRQKGCAISGYIDDFFVLGNSYEECFENLRKAILLFLKLGFTLHPEKSVLVPSQSLIFLGFRLDSAAMTVSLTQEKKAKLKLLCLKAFGKGNLVIRFVAQVIGKIVSSLPGVEFGRLHYRHLERDKIQALRRSQGDYDSVMHLSEAAKCELNWWLDVDSHLSRRIKHAPCSLVFQTDASDSGWGVRCVSDGALQSQGVWSRDQRTLHINVRELYVVFICLTIFCRNVTGVYLKFELDNTTAVAYINSMGGSKSRLCDAVARKIWAWCIPRDIWVSAIYIPGRTNVVADRLSREHHSDHEWMLNRQMFSKLCVLYPGLSIDLFATTLNAQLPKFASWRPDPRAAFVDGFSRSWHGEYFYAFPPFSLIQRCLDRVELDQAQGVLLVPAWPTQTWYTRLLQMLSGQPVVMVWTAQSDLLIHPSGPKMHNLQGRLSLMACPVSGNSIESRAFGSTLPMFSSAHGGQLLRNSTQSILKNGLCSVVQGRLLRVHRI